MMQTTSAFRTANETSVSTSRVPNDFHIRSRRIMGSGWMALTVGASTASVIRWPLIGGIVALILPRPRRAAGLQCVASSVPGHEAADRRGRATNSAQFSCRLCGCAAYSGIWRGGPVRRSSLEKRLTAAAVRAS